jgi:hypothetical protein
MCFAISIADVQGQYMHKIKADTVKLYNDACTTEFILQNATRNTNGFLYNKGNGVTEFRKALIKLTDSTYLIGSDTLYLAMKPTGITSLGVVTTGTWNATPITNQYLANNSIGFTLGSSGSAPNVTSSVALGGTATLNLPLAGSTVSSGLITNTNQNIAGNKTFSGASVFTGGLQIQSTGLSLYNASNTFKIHSQTAALSADRTIDFPDASGTLALGTGTNGQYAKWNGANNLTTASASSVASDIGAAASSANWAGTASQWGTANNFFQSGITHADPIGVMVYDNTSASWKRMPNANLAGYLNPLLGLSTGNWVDLTSTQTIIGAKKFAGSTTTIQGPNNSRILFYPQYSGAPSNAGMEMYAADGTLTFQHNTNGGTTNTSGTLSANKFVNNGTSAFSAPSTNGSYVMYADAAIGLVLAGRGSVNDVTIVNKNGGGVMEIPTGTLHASFAGNINAVAAGSIGTTLGVGGYPLSGDFGADNTVRVGLGVGAKGLNFGYNSTQDYAFVGAVHNGTAWKNTVLQPIGGNVGIGRNPTAYRFEVEGSVYAATTLDVGSTITSGASSLLFNVASNTHTSSKHFRIRNNGSDMIFGIDRSSGGDLAHGVPAYSGYLGTVNATPFGIGTNNNLRWTLGVTGNFAPATDAAYDLGHSTAKIRDAFFGGVIYAYRSASDVVLEGGAVYMPGGYTSLRTGTDQSFNIDNYNGGSRVNALKITPSGIILTPGLQFENTANDAYVGSRSSRTLTLGTNGAGRWMVETDGQFRPQTDNTYDLGSASHYVRNIYAKNAMYLGNGTTSVGQVLNGVGSGSSVGAAVVLQNASVSTIGLGNFSALVGGAYNNQPTLWVRDILNVYSSSNGGNLAYFSANGSSIYSNLNLSGSLTVGTGFNATGTINGQWGAAALANNSYSNGNFQAVITNAQYNAGARAGYGFHNAGLNASYLYMEAYGDYRFREASGVTYNLIHTGNVQNHAPTLTGSGASGTWGINISGTAANASAWGGYSNNFTTTEATPDYMITMKAGVGRVSNADQIRDWLSNLQGRFKSWYTSGTGIAAEIGISGSQAHVLGYDRTNSRYVPMTISGGDGVGGSNSSLTLTTGSSSFSHALTINGNVTASAGNIYSKGSAGNHGYASLIQGGAGNAGYLEIYKGGASGYTPQRLLYIGYDNTDVSYAAENGAKHVFAGGIVSVTAGLHTNNTVADIRRLQMGTSSGTYSGISYYDNSYTTWQTYMAPAGAGGRGFQANITAPSGWGVDSWALRSYIEDSGGYGWTWESGSGSADATPTVVAELTSANGNFRTRGTIAAGGTGSFDNGTRKWMVDPGNGNIYHEYNGVRETQIAYSGGGIWFGATSGSAGSGATFSHSTGTGNTTTTGVMTASSFYESSDTTLKDISKWNYSSSTIPSIEYTWKPELKKDKLQHVGYPAQVVQQYMPDAVIKDADGKLTVNYDEVHTKKIADLEKRDSDKDKTIAQMQKRIDDMEALMLQMRKQMQK